MTCGFAARAVLIGALVCGCKGGGEGTGSGGADAGLAAVVVPLFPGIGLDHAPPRPPRVARRAGLER
jgi:hypothetical protein